MGRNFERLFVSPSTVEGEGAGGPQTCLQVRWSPDAPWEIFYDHIDGFDYRPGVAYTLLVEVTRVEDPPADASSLRYSLVRVEEEIQAS